MASSRTSALGELATAAEEEEEAEEEEGGGGGADADSSPMRECNATAQTSHDKSSDTPASPLPIEPPLPLLPPAELRRKVPSKWSLAPSSPRPLEEPCRRSRCTCS